MTAVAARRIEESPYVILIVYTTSDDAAACGYEPWLIEVDNPFFNAIPGVLAYQNWKVEGAHTLPYSYFDLQGLETEADLERVWFNPTLDNFRKNWIKLWGYGRAPPQPIHLHAYGLRPVFASNRPPQSTASISAGTGPLPTDADLVWRVDEVIRKHFATTEQGTRWRWPARENNPFGRTWFAVRYGHISVNNNSDALDNYSGRLIAAPASSSAQRS